MLYVIQDPEEYNKKKKMNTTSFGFVLISLLLFLTFTHSSATKDNLVDITLVENATTQGAVCLDGSPPAYHLDRGFGSGANNWLLFFEGGGWCRTIKQCLKRAITHRGSSTHMEKQNPFVGIMSKNASLNPDFYNWNRVRIRYCDGGSFSGDSMYKNGTDILYFRGQRIWKAIILDLLPKGLNVTEKALLSGCSAGGLATFLHCDDFTTFLPKNATTKCMSDAGVFLDIKDINSTHTAREKFEKVVALQGAKQFLNENCTSSSNYTSQCFFPQYALSYVKAPYFILNSAYDTYQFKRHLVPPSTDPSRYWEQCKNKTAACDVDQLNILQGLRSEMINALSDFNDFSETGGMFINSCFAHCQAEYDETWFAPDSPRIHNKTIAESVGDWYFERTPSRLRDDAYPSNCNCPNVTD
ncbi:pectin acetylesterase 9-like isoform X2 [Papaver somniferum]|uniref:pectin acetylesterase 9-like isoform X2 n=1 Tax=Papaver somniferum TaxID=3469 RepID=UPI000E70045F|nr:pectin acetylesterase 9-like isoform X2 [Papaver somniferum]